MDTSVLVELRESSSSPQNVTIEGPDYVDMSSGGGGDGSSTTVTASLYKDLSKLSELLKEHVIPKTVVAVSPPPPPTAAAPTTTWSFSYCCCYRSP